jgi:hypothetical protein
MHHVEQGLGSIACGEAQDDRQSHGAGGDHGELHHGHRPVPGGGRPLGDGHARGHPREQVLRIQCRLVAGFRTIPPVTAPTTNKWAPTLSLIHENEVVEARGGGQGGGAGRVDHHLQTTAIPISQPGRNEALLALARLDTSITMMAMIGRGLMATPIARGVSRQWLSRCRSTRARYARPTACHGEWPGCHVGAPCRPARGEPLQLLLGRPDGDLDQARAAGPPCSACGPHVGSV